MANRQWQAARTQGHEHVDLPVVIKGNGSSTPKLGEGDANGSYWSVFRSGTGAYILTSKDTYAAVVAVDASQVGTWGATWNVTVGVPTQNTNGTWNTTITVVNNNTYNSATATDMTTNQQLHMWVRFRNSGVTP